MLLCNHLVFLQHPVTVQNEWCLFLEAKTKGVDWNLLDPKSNGLLSDHQFPYEKCHKLSTYTSCSDNTKYLDVSYTMLYHVISPAIQIKPRWHLGGEVRAESLYNPEGYRVFFVQNEVPGRKKKRQNASPNYGSFPRLITKKCCPLDIAIRLPRIYLFGKTLWGVMFILPTRHHIITHKRFCSKHLFWSFHCKALSRVTCSLASSCLFYIV